MIQYFFTSMVILLVNYLLLTMIQYFFTSMVLLLVNYLLLTMIQYFFTSMVILLVNYLLLVGSMVYLVMAKRGYFLVHHGNSSAPIPHDSLQYVYPVKNTKCKILYIFTFCSILAKRSSEKYTTDKMYILYQSHVPFRLYISLWITFVFVVCTCHKTGNKQREKLFLLQIWQDRQLLPALIGRATPQTWKSITAGFC
jgi:hypothetical protein